MLHSLVDSAILDFSNKKEYSFDLFVSIAYFCGSEQAEASAAH